MNARMKKDFKKEIKERERKQIKIKT